MCCVNTYIHSLKVLLKYGFFSRDYCFIDAPCTCIKMHRIHRVLLTSEIQCVIQREIIKMHLIVYHNHFHSSILCQSLSSVASCCRTAVSSGTSWVGHDGITSTAAAAIVQRVAKQTRRPLHTWCDYRIMTDQWRHLALRRLSMQAASVTWTDDTERRKMMRCDVA